MDSNIRFKYHDHEVSYKKFRLMVKDEVILGTVDRIIKPIEDELADARCPVHGQAPEVIISLTEEGDLNVHTHACCDEFKRQTNTNVQVTFHRTAYFNPGLRVLLLPAGENMPYSFDAEQIETLSIGRSDTDYPERPDVDLEPLGARELGVSRKHASIMWYKGALHIVDEGSSNGTYINGEKIEAHLPHILRDDDQLYLGGLSIRVLLMGGAK